MDVATLVFDIDSGPARTAAKDLLTLDKAATTAAGGFADLEKAQERLTRGDNGQFASRAAVVEKYGNEVRGLAGDFNPALAAMLAFEQAQERLARAQRLGVIQTQAQADAIRTQLTTAYQHAIATGTRFDASMATAGGRVGQLGHQFQNASYQVGDFFVQIASGTSATQALAQQLPQLLGGFGVLGAALGAVAAIGGALIPMWLGMGKEVKTVEDAIEELNARIDAYKDAAERASMGTTALISEFGLAAGRAREMYTALAAIEQLQLGQELSLGVSGISKTFEDLAFQLRSYDMAVADTTGRLAGVGASIEANIVEKFGLGVAEAHKLQDAIEAAKLAKGPAAVATEMQKVVKLFTDAQAAGAKIPPEMVAAAKQAAELTISADRLQQILNTTVGTIGSATGQTSAWAGSMASVLGYVNAIGRALSSIGGGAIQFAGQAAEIAALKEGRSLQQSSIAGARERARLESKEIVNGLGIQNDLLRKGAEFMVNASKQAQISQSEELANLQEIQRKREAAAAKGAAGGGGGKAAANKAAAETAAAEKGFQSVRELMEKESIFQFAEYEKRQGQLDAALAKKLLSEQTYQEMAAQLRTMYFGAEYEINALQYQMDLDQLNQHFANKLISEEEYNRKRREMQWQNLLNEENRSAMATDLANTASYFGQLNSLTGSSYNSLLKLQQTFQAASALMNAYTGASQTLADPTVPYWVKIAAAGKVLAAGLGFMAAIKSGGSSGGSRGGSSGSTGATAATAKAAPTKEVLVRLTGDKFLVDMADQIMTEIYQQSKDGRVIVARDL